MMKRGAICGVIALKMAMAGAQEEIVGPDDAAGIDDPYIWLEDVEGEEALDWVEAQNEVSVGYLESLPTFHGLYDRNLDILNSDERIAAPGLRGDHVFNFWRDAANIRGLWRRTTVEDYVSGNPDWETILDLDALAEAEGENWVWKGASCLRPDYRLCALHLSRGGADAVVIREFDVEERAFVDDGFLVPEAKSSFSLDRRRYGVHRDRLR